MHVRSNIKIHLISIIKYNFKEILSYFNIDLRQFHLAKIFHFLKKFHIIKILQIITISALVLQFF